MDLLKTTGVMPGDLGKFLGTSGYETWIGFELASASLELYPVYLNIFICINQYMQFAAFIISSVSLVAFIEPCFSQHFKH